MPRHTGQVLQDLVWTDPVILFKRSEPSIQCNHLSQDQRCQKLLDWRTQKTGQKGIIRPRSNLNILE